jgi:hypothetical protein
METAKVVLARVSAKMSILRVNVVQLVRRKLGKEVQVLLGF